MQPALKHSCYANLYSRCLIDIFSKNNLHANIINENNLNFLRVMSFLPKSFERKKNHKIFFFLVMFCTSIFLNIVQMLNKIKKKIFVFSPFWTFFLLMEWLSSKGHNLVYFWKNCQFECHLHVFIILEIFNLF